MDDVTMTVSVDGVPYTVRRVDDGIEVGQPADGRVSWFDDPVPLAALPPAARAAVESGTRDDVALVMALRGIVSAYAERGG